MSIDDLQKANPLILQKVLGARDQTRGTDRTRGHQGCPEKTKAKNRQRAKMAKASRKRNR